MKDRLLAPGPTPVPDRVLREMSRTIIHHRTDQFEGIFKECQDRLAWLLNADSPPLILTSSGTGAFEAAIQSFFNKGDQVLCITGGKFADNWLKMSQCFGLEAIEIPVLWGDAVDRDQVEAALEAYPKARAVILVASETSTGVKHAFQAIGELVKQKSDCLFLVDAVTAVGVMDIEPQRDHIDLLVFGSQKGLMLPPGLAFVWVSEKAWARSEKAGLPRFYFDLGKEKNAQAKHQSAHTPAVSLIIGLKEALNMLKEEGRTSIFARHRRLCEGTRAAMSALGLTLFAKSPSEAITSVVAPAQLKSNAVYDGLMSMANFTIAGGQEKLAGKIFRIGHMGYVDEIDLVGAFFAIETVLFKSGYEQFTPGDSIKAAFPIFKAGFKG